MQTPWLHWIVATTLFASSAFGQATSEGALIAAADRILQRAAKPKFTEIIELENAIARPDNARTQQASGLLQFRRIQLIARATERIGEENLRKNDVAMTWVRNHSEFLKYYEPDNDWYVVALPAWKLFEQNKQAPWADDLAWMAAQLLRPADACTSECVLQVKIIDGPLQYWTRFPKGTHIDQALERATAKAKYASEMACYDKHPNPKSESPMPPEMVRRIRETLAPVTRPGKQLLLTYLADGEKKCASR